MIFDTDIVVWMLRNCPRALHFAEGVRPPDRDISGISCLELLYGCRNQKEIRDLQQLVAGWFAEIVPVTPITTESARRLMEKFVLSRRPDVGDVLIAATALERGEMLATCNRKHFDFIPGLEIKLLQR